ncbi:MAG TPA: malto-oligosyltrehalose synthase [Opitutaceae bacterium]|nr:malto-oligosyltrehalose synthase [Opitutaceae bacterium]
MPLAEANRTPLATYRVQLNPAFTFRDLAAQLDHLLALGVTDFYLSPILTASTGSLHGYDVNDYTSVSPELGGREGFERFSDEARRHGAGVLVDIVPNHMGIAGPRNAWWHDVLMWGRRSAYAPFFDIDWQAGGDRVLLPVLAHHYGRELERGRLALEFGAGFLLRYGDLLLPVHAESHAQLLQALTRDAGLPSGDRAEATAFASDFHRLAQVPATESRDESKERTRRLQRVQARLAEWAKSRPAVRARLDEHLRRLNGTPGRPESFVELDALIGGQHYRPARWKAGAHEINYRRFFAISSLVGLRMEDPEAFRESHQLIADLLREGRITGLRVDHIDGLRQPAGYLRRLQALAPAEKGAPLYVAVEKILAAPGESLPADWPVQGATGYEFIPEVAGLMVDPAAADAFTATYRRFTGHLESYEDEVYARKRQVLEELFAHAIDGLGSELAEITNADWRWQDLTAHELVAGVREIMAGLSVYRTYRETTGPAGPADRAAIAAAARAAIARNPRSDPQPFEFVRDLLAGDYPPARAAPELQRRLLDWVLTFQQYTGAVMAKAVEDTAFYTYGRFVALNEVGGSPAAFGAPLEMFHAACRRRLEASPLGLLATSTHDTKFSEDVRARLYALSELPDEWNRWVERWHVMNHWHLTDVDGAAAPDRRDEYRFYQILLGVWPLDSGAPTEALRDRLCAHIRKAVDEAKRHTSLLRPNEPYLQACERFVRRVASPDTAGAFLADFAPCAERLARLGMVNSLAQLVLKCTAPGVPDFYQGTETWEFSLVDPDNRRPVDHALRHQARARAGRSTMAGLMEHWRDGAIKVRVMQRLLQLRAAVPDLFLRGGYRPVAAEGTHAARVAAFLRETPGHAVLVAVPRLAAALGAPPVGAAWGDTRLDPGNTPPGAWRDVIADRIHREPGFNLRQLFADAPFAVLEHVDPRPDHP